MTREGGGDDATAAALLALLAGAAPAPAFAPTPLADELLESLIREAASAPAPRVEPHAATFVVVTGDQRERLIARISEALGRRWGLGLSRPRGLAAQPVLDAPAFVLAFSRVPSSEGLEAASEVLAAVQNLTLLAVAHGLATHRLPGPALVPEAVSEFVAGALGPEVWSHELVAMLAIGTPQGTHRPARELGPAPLWIGREPVRRSEPVAAVASAPQTPASMLRAQGEERVLVVDPYQHNRAEAARQLTAAGYVVEVFADGASALARADRAPELALCVISDALPDLSGFELIRQLKARRAQAPPMMMTTARRDSAFRIGGLTAGVHYYLRKPVNPIELLTAARILLDRRRLVTQLGRLNAFQEALLSAMQDVGVVALDESYRIRYVTPGMARMVGFSEEELIGRFPMDLSQGNPSALVEVHDEDELETHKQDARLPGRVDVTMRRKDGSTFDAELIRSPMREASEPAGKLSGYLGVVVDISTRKAAERELARANQELSRVIDELTRTQHKLVQQAKMASLGQLVAGVAHEINTPLGAVVSNNDLFKRCFQRLSAALSGSPLATVDRVAKDLAAIEDLQGVTKTACDRITNIVRELRVFARMDEPEPQVVDLHECLESTLLLVGHLAKGRVALTREYASGLPPVACHPNQLNQVFMNLIVNACQAIEGPGQVVIRTRRAGDSVRVDVADDGAGIKPEHLSRIFDPGFTTKGAGVGTGLGLSICYQIVEAHGGEISVASEVGKGTTFTVTLPSAPEPRAGAGVDDDHSSAAT